MKNVELNEEWIKFNPRELESGLYWVFGYQEEIDGDVDDYGRNIARYTGDSEPVKSIAYITITEEDGEFYLEKMNSLIFRMQIDDIDEDSFVPSFVIPITPPII